MRASFILTFFLLQLGAAAYSQKKICNFQILRNGSQVGTMIFTHTVAESTDSLEMESNVKTKLVSTFLAHGKETAIFQKGILLKSSIFREVNGKEKANKKHEARNGQYVIYKGNTSKISSIFPISYNMLSLYAWEPEQLSKVYSDNFEAFVTIQKLSDHKYKIELPDGNYNLYTYKEGKLQEVEVHHTLYSAVISTVNK